MPNPVDNSDLFDAIVVAGKRSPGFVKLSGHKRAHKWDIKEADGAGGASTTYKGESIAQFTATFTLVKDDVAGTDDFAAWETFATLLRSALPSSGKPKALTIYHPDLAKNDIKTVCPATIGGMEHDGKGGASITVDFVEYRPPKKKGGAPTGTKTSTTSKVDPNADLKAELDRLLVEAKKP
jgi:hypothetical protein